MFHSVYKNAVLNFFPQFSRLCPQPQPIFRITHTTLFQLLGFLANCCACCSVTLHQKMVLSKAAWLSVWKQFSIKHRNHQNLKRCSILMQRMQSCLRLSHSSSTMTGEPLLNQHCMHVKLPNGWATNLTECYLSHGDCSVWCNEWCKIQTQHCISVL